MLDMLLFLELPAFRALLRRSVCWKTVVSSARAADTERSNGSNTINQAEYKAQTRGQKNSPKNPLSMRNPIHYSKRFYNFPMKIIMQNTTLQFLPLKKKDNTNTCRLQSVTDIPPNVKELVHNSLEGDETVGDNVVR